jgi:hypothetical protein
MKSKYILLSKIMIAFLLSAVIFAGCSKKDSMISSANDINTTSATTTATTMEDNSSTVSASAYRTNQSPIIKTGPDQTYAVAVSSITLDGSGSSDPDGSISSYLWTKDFGPGTVSVASPFSAKTTVTGLTAGSYRFKLKITDNSGATVTDTIHITNGSGGTPPPPPGNQAPVVNAGSNQTITSPASSLTLSGSATDADGTIASYLWTKASGTGGTITNPNAASTTVTGLTAGSYVFNLKATDNGGAAGNKTVTITVNATALTGGNYGTLMYSTGYDQLSDIVNSSNQLGQGSISTSVYKVGPGSFKSLVNTSPLSNISAGWRAEVQYSQSYSPDGADITVEYDVNYEKLFTDNGLTTQWHGNASGTSGQLSLWIQGGQFMVMRSVQTGVNQYQSGTLMTVQANKWYHMRWEIRFSSGSDGYVRLYIDNVLYYSATGKTSDGTGQYLKIGTNRWNISTESILYYDNLKIWKK